MSMKCDLQTTISRPTHERNLLVMRRPLPPLNALKAFEATARHLSFSKAAEELHVTPAALSHQIRGLEDLLASSCSIARRAPSS